MPVGPLLLPIADISGNLSTAFVVKQLSAIDLKGGT
jgi:hypothetical protein